MPLSVSAAVEEAVPGARHRGLTINGLPLSQFLSLTATPRATFPLVGFLPHGSGLIRGVALDGDGQPVADGAVQLRHVAGQGGRLL